MSAVSEVLPGLWRIRISGGYVNAYLVAGEDLVLVDTGLTGRAKTLLAAIADAGRKPDDLSHILITHHHTDHTGSLAALKEQTGATVHVPTLDVAISRGDAPVPGPAMKGILPAVLGPVFMRLQPRRLPPVEIEHQVEDGDEIAAAGGIKAVFTPGHTVGHTSYLMPGKGGVLFAGDAAGHFRGLAPPVGFMGGMFTADPEQAKESFRKLAALEFDAACFGHGGPITGKANVAFRRTVEKMAR